MLIKYPVKINKLASSSDKPPISQSVVASRWLAVFSLLGLIVLGLGWELFWAPVGSGMLALKVLPLTLPLAGILKNRMYTYRWVSLLVWVYFTEGVVRVSGDRGLSAVLAGIEIGLCLLLFAACALHVRARLSTARQASTEPY
ncbi:MAG: DUF2069 domain-containing protein [Burkholderiales bacterium]|jgi:uncharacterized membrane protein